MKKVLLSMFLILILSGCSVDGNGEKKENDLFKKKQECLKYEQDIKNNISQDGGVITELFYSPSKNTCVYIYNQNIAGEDNQFIIDYLTKETIFCCDGKIRNIDTCNEKIKELKGE